MYEIKPIAVYQPLPWQIPPLLCREPIMLLTGSAGGGKALSLDTEIPTTTGWKTMQSIQVGDVVFDRFGQPTEVVGATDVLLNRPCYRIEFSTGESVVCDENHLWFVYRNGNQNKLHVLPTSFLAETYYNERLVYSVPVVDRVDHTDQLLPIDPYVLGVLLGDGYVVKGSVSFVSGDQEIVDLVTSRLSDEYSIVESDKRKNCSNYSILSKLGRIAHKRRNAKGWFVRKHNQSGGYMGFVRLPGGAKKYVGYSKNKEDLEIICSNYSGEHYSQEELSGSDLLYNLRKLEVWGKKSSTKFVPEIYKQASYDQKLELIRGLMDTDGSIDKKRGRVEFCSISRQLTLDVHEICCSLGIKSHFAERYVTLNGKKYLAYRVQFTDSVQVFHLSRKARYVKSKLRPTQHVRYITRIEDVSSVSVRCIEVAAKDGSYLITRSYLPTHNSRTSGEKIHAYLKKYPGTMGLMLRKQRNSMDNSTVLFMDRTVIGDDPEVIHYPSKRRFEYANGSILAYGGMDGDEQKEQIRSIGQEGALHIVWMEEANRFTEDDFNEILARMRGRGVDWRQIILTTNPDSPTHWIYQRLILGGEAEVFYSSAIDNTYNANDYIKTLQKLTGVTRKRLTEGQWVQATGSIYDEFNLKDHVVVMSSPPKDWTRILSIDFGYVNAFVCLWGAVDPDGRVHIYKELYHSRRTVTTHCKMILEEIEKEGIEPDVVICDHDAEDRETLNEMGLPNIPANKDVERGIQVVKDRLKVQGDGKPRVFFYQNSLLEVDEYLKEKKKPLRLLDEIPGYSWKETKDTMNPKEEPIKLNDHALDALRYLLVYVDTFENQGMDFAK